MCDIVSYFGSDFGKSSSDIPPVIAVRNDNLYLCIDHRKDSKPLSICSCQWNSATGSGANMGKISPNVCSVRGMSDGKYRTIDNPSVLVVCIWYRWNLSGSLTDFLLLPQKVKCERDSDNKHDECKKKDKFFCET